MSDLILFSQQQAYKGFLDKVGNQRGRRASSHVQKPLKTNQLQFQPSSQIEAAINKLVKNFRDSLKAFLEQFVGIDFNYIMYTFKKQNVLEELSLMVNSKMIDENRSLQQTVEANKQLISRLKFQNESLLHKESYATHRENGESKNNFNATSQQGNNELSRVLFDKAKSCGLEEFHEVVNTYFLKDKVKVTAIKEWPKGIDPRAEEQAKSVLHQAINQVRKTITKETSKSSGQYIGNILKEHFLGKRQKFQIVVNMLTNETILRYLQNMFENGGANCARPCCQMTRRPDIPYTRQPSPKQSTRYLLGTRRSSDACYKSDQVSNYMQKFNNSMRERNAKQTDIRSISKSNLEATESFEKFFNKQLNKRKKMEYKEKQRMDEQLRDFIRSIK